MAKQNEDTTLIKFTADAERELDAMMEEVERAEKTIDDIEEVGIDLSRLKERTNWARKVITAIRKGVK